MKPLWTPTPTPETITIDRADLPEVDSNDDGLLWIGSKSFSSESLPAERRRIALEQLALAEFWEAREAQAAEDAAAEKLGEQVMQKRRDELAREIAKTLCFSEFDSFTYADHVIAVQVAIDMLIAEQDAAKC